MESNGTKFLENFKQNKIPLKRRFSYSNCKKEEKPKLLENKTNQIPYHSLALADSGTQTSKTIIQLAQIESQFSPDSLNVSPRYEEPSKLLNIPQLESKLKAVNTDSLYRYIRQDPLLNKKCVSRYTVRCPNIETMSQQEKVNTHPNAKLTETFLKRKRQEAHSSRSDRSRFLQQTSPLRNLTKGFASLSTNDTKLRSQSYIEPSSLAKKFQDDIPCRISKQEVEDLKEQHVDDTPEAINYFWSIPNQQDAEKNESCRDEDHFNNQKDQFDHEENHFNPKQRPVLQKRCSSFMSPTIASEQRSMAHNIQLLRLLIPPTKRGRSLSPNTPNRGPSYPIVPLNKNKSLKIPYIDQSTTTIEVNTPKLYKQNISAKKLSRVEQGPVPLIAPLATRPKFDDDILKIDLQSSRPISVESCERTTVSRTESSSSNENLIWLSINRVKHPDWNVALRGLAEMTELCRIMDPDLLYNQMTIVNQRLLELLRSPRSHVCRTACQAAGHFFESMKDTRRPEFDDIVEVLLNKTADANKFIREDANLSLDCMVTHIPISHAVRALCLKGPIHKNYLVRKATIRLIICTVVIASPALLLTLPAHETSRKRVLQHLAKFLEDKNSETRKYGERLYKILSKEPTFELCLKKYMEKEEIARMKNGMKLKTKT